MAYGDPSEYKLALAQCLVAAGYCSGDASAIEILAAAFDPDACSLKTTMSGAVEVDGIDDVVTCLEELKDKVQENTDAINDKPLPPTVDVEYVANETTGFYDKVVTTTPTNLDGTPGTPVVVTTQTTYPVDGPAPTPPVDYEIKELSSKCFENAAGDKFTLNSYIPYEGGVAQTPVQVWQDEAGAILTTPPTGVTPCVDEATTESVSEVEVCADGKNAIMKTVADSEGTEVVTFYDETGLITPTAWTVGVCPVDQSTKQVESPDWYIGDNGGFLGSRIYDDGTPIGWDVVSGTAPSGLAAVAPTEYGYSITAEFPAGQTLDNFLVANQPNFQKEKILSLTIHVVKGNDEVFEYSIRGGAKTVIDVNETVEFGNGQNYAFSEKWANEFEAVNDSLITVVWEQGEI